MAYNNKQLLIDQDNRPIPQQYDQANDIYVPLLKMEYYGKSTSTKPSPSKTPIGATYMEVDTKNIYMNDGTTWSLL
ncbi:hypothetical protein [Bacillus xiapuensis]|uniref:Uncharacterized protein n=1 Tax=Bacillus xiapuensis TaxID=2014075 RepID=A0ABU6N7P2_9BACI|nr:hypothetical protein [Bacillus xiapuensis]